MNIQWLDEFNRLLNDTYQISKQASERDFKRLILERLKKTLSLDTAFWMTRSEVDTPYTVEETFTYNLPDDVQENYIKNPTVYQQSLSLVEALMENMGKTLDVKDIIPQSEWITSDIYLLHCKKYDIEHSIMTLFASDHNQMIDSISLNRQACHLPFTQQERELVQAYVPHMVEAERLNRLRSFQVNQGSYSLRGMLDKHGKVIEADLGFEQARSLLSIDLDEMSFSGLDTFDAQSGAYYRATREAGNIGLEIKPQSPWGLLSPRKVEVARLLVQGKPNKAIANELSVSVETINEYLGDMFRMLGVASRYQAISALSNEGSLKVGHMLLSQQHTLLYQDDYASEILANQSVGLSTLVERLDDSLGVGSINGIILQSEKQHGFIRISLIDYSDSLAALSDREGVIAYLVSNLLSNNAIATKLSVSVKTVENQLTSIYRKLSVRNRSELVALLN